MNIVTKINEWLINKKNYSGKSIGFVPTMGNLHDGHLSLCQRSKLENDITVVSIFVNPTQFNQINDFQLYPRTLEDDKKMLSTVPIDYLFCPDAMEIYPDNYSLQMTETELGMELEGKCRPGHFSGMLTVVLKLLNLVQPTRIYLGEKDYQQLLLVKKMIDALFLPIEVVPCPTIRAYDGLALSSRNSRLSSEQRAIAMHFPRLLQSAFPIETIIHKMKELNFEIDYVVEKWQRRLGAVWLGEVRLIDNFMIIR